MTPDQAPVPKVSVVMATRNRADRLKRALAALKAQDATFPFEVVVVDDASTDQTPAVLEAWMSDPSLDLKTCRRQSSGGPGGARNTGLEIARGCVVAFTDDDCEPEPGWLSALEETARAHPSALVQGPTIPNPDDAELAGPFSRTLEVGSLGPWFPTSNVAYPREALEALDGFDETLSRGEDTDLAWRAQESGLEAVWSEGAVVRHAVMELGPVGKLQLAAAWSPAVRVIALHPHLRQELVAGVFWKRSHALLFVALAGLVLARVWRPAVLLVLPYVRYLRATVAQQDVGTGWVAYQALHDLTEVAAMAHGSVRARTFLL